MAVRLQMRLGIVAENERLQDSPDRILAVEPTIGSVARSKGNLYLLVTCRQSGRGPRDAARFVADAIRELYYYDESAGIRVCIVKAIVAANKRLAHDRDRYGLRLDEAGHGPVGIALAVVRGGELYVATVGPAEAYLVRGGRLSTLPDPHRERGLPSTGIEPEVWRGEVAVGDVLALVSPNLVERLDVDELRDAMTTLRPQSAMEHLHHRFVASDGRGSDGALAIEATEVAATQKHVTLVPVRPPEPLAGAPDRSPIPLADTVSDGVAAVRGSARSARSAAGAGAGRLVGSLLDTLPQRNSTERRVTTASSRRESQRRGALAVIAITTLVALGAVGVFVTSGGRTDADLSSLTVGQRALRQAQSDLDQVSANGVDLVADDPGQAERLLTDAYQQLSAAESAGIPATATDPLRVQTVTALDRLYHMMDVVPGVAFSFANLKGAALRALVRGPDDVPYVLDAGTKAVYRIDLKARKAVPIVRMGTAAGGTKVAEPRLLAVGGPDLLILDAKNQLWRWRPADKKGAGTLTRVKVNGSVQWGPDVSAIGTFIRNADAGLYNLYVVDPSEKQIDRYSPAADGSGFPAAPSGYLQTPQVLDGVVQLYIDGDIFLVDSGSVVRYVSGTSRDWKMGAPGDTILRPAPRYEAMASASDSRQGEFYAWDAANDRVVAFDKATGHFLGQYRLAGGSTAWNDVRAMLVDVPADGSAPRLWWIDGSRLMSALLTPAGGTSASDGTSTTDGTTGGTGRGSAGAGSSAAPGAKASSGVRSGASASPSN